MNDAFPLDDDLWASGGDAAPAAGHSPAATGDGTAASASDPVDPTSAVTSESKGELT